MDIRAYIEQLNTRERYLLLLTGLVLAFYIFYTLLYSPLANSVVRKQLILFENKQTLLWMEGVYAQHHKIQRPEVLSSEKLLYLLSNQLKTSNLKDFAYQIEQTGSGDIHLTFAQVAYNEFLQWLWFFCGKHALIVKQFTATAKNYSGVVKISVTLSQD